MHECKHIRNCFEIAIEISGSVVDSLKIWCHATTSDFTLNYAEHQWYLLMFSKSLNKIDLMNENLFVCSQAQFLRIYLIKMSHSRYQFTVRYVKEVAKEQKKKKVAHDNDQYVYIRLISSKKSYVLVFSCNDTVS